MSKCLAQLLAPCLVSTLFLPITIWCQASQGRMESVSVSPDGKTIGVDFIKDKKSHLFLIAVDTGNATRLTDDNKGAPSQT